MADGRTAALGFITEYRSPTRGVTTALGLVVEYHSEPAVEIVLIRDVLQGALVPAVQGMLAIQGATCKKGSVR